MLRNITVPPYLWSGIRPNRNGFDESGLRLFGGDTETVQGQPYTLQFYDGIEARLLDVDAGNVFEAFLRYFRDKLTSRVNVCFFHNLEFDLGILAYPFKEGFASSYEPQTITGRGWKLRVWYGKRCWAKVWIGQRRLWLLDSFAFVDSSLDAFARTIGVAVPKLEKPAYLGERAPSAAERPAFETYAKHDALLAYQGGRWILEQHRQFDVRLSVSLPQFAARVLRHHFFRESETIPIPSKQVCRWAELSYHGGKNGCYVKPGLYKRVAEADLTSAYAWAMTQVPQMVSGRYVRVRFVHPPSEPGIYCVTGRTGRCRYPIFHQHNFTPIGAQQDFQNLWVTSYELHEALRCRDVSLSRVWGIVWCPEAGYRHNPLADYNTSFFEKKEASAQGDPRRLIFKLLCNALYGKFIQHSRTDAMVTLRVGQDGSGAWEEPVYEAGGLYHPFLGSLITGFVRARMHQLEVEYEALHTATDSIKTRQPVRESAGLGGLREVVRGDCLLLRNKLYLHFNEAGRLTKWALHGFHGTKDDLLAMVNERRVRYTVRRMLKLREAIRQGRQPFRMETQTRHLDVPALTHGLVVFA